MQTGRDPVAETWRDATELHVVAHTDDSLGRLRHPRLYAARWTTEPQFTVHVEELHAVVSHSAGILPAARSVRLCVAVQSNDVLEPLRHRYVMMLLRPPAGIAMPSVTFQPFLMGLPGGMSVASAVIVYAPPTPQLNVPCLLHAQAFPDSRARINVVFIQSQSQAPSTAPVNVTDTVSSSALHDPHGGGSYGAQQGYHAAIATTNRNSRFSVSGSTK